MSLLRDVYSDGRFDEASDSTTFFDRVTVSAPQLALIAADLPGLSGNEADLLSRIRQQQPSTSLLVLTDPATTSDHQVLHLVRHGVSGILSRTAPLATIRETVRLLLSGVRSYDEHTLSLLQRQLITRSRYAKRSAAFSKRELEVLRLMGEDRPNTEIADSLCVSVRTVEFHRRQMMQKAGTRTTLGLILFAVRQGVFSELTP